jgi:hypothetical protein
MSTGRAKTKPDFTRVAVYFQAFFDGGRSFRRRKRLQRLITYWRELFVQESARI